MLEEGATEAKILDLIRGLAPDAPAEIRPEHRLREDLGLDSVASMELVGVLSERFDVEIEIEEAIQVQDVRGIVEMARKRLGEDGGSRDLP